VPSPEQDPFELLRTAQAATGGDLRRAYLRAVVWTHRTGVFDIVARLDGLKRAYDIVRTPGAARRDPRVEVELGIRSEASREVLRHSLRIGAVAQRENLETVRHLVAEYDQLELDAARSRVQRRRVEWIVRIIGAALFILGILWSSRRLVR
jgi:hypothetical protein